MTAKTIEIRDRATFIPALAVSLDPSNESDKYLLARAGFGTSDMPRKSHTFLITLTGHPTTVVDPDGWVNQRTLGTAHRWIIDHFDLIESGQVVDVEYILGESDDPKVSERFDE